MALHTYASIARRNVNGAPKRTSHKRRHDVKFIPKNNVVVMREGEII